MAGLYGGKAMTSNTDDNFWRRDNLFHYIQKNISLSLVIVIVACLLLAVGFFDNVHFLT